MAKNSFVAEVAFNKVKQKRGAIHFFHKKPSHWSSFQIFLKFGML